MCEECQKLELLRRTAKNLDFTQEIVAVSKYWVGKGLVYCPVCGGVVSVDIGLKVWVCTICGKKGGLS